MAKFKIKRVVSGRMIGRRFVANKKRSRNIAAGFYDEDGYFHPIRASHDYDPKRGGDRPKKKAKARRR